MGVSDLVAAFNSVDPSLRCERATMGIVRTPAEGDKPAAEWQKLAFYGSGPTGVFVAESELLPPSADLIAAARDAATAYLNQPKE